MYFCTLLSHTVRMWVRLIYSVNNIIHVEFWVDIYSHLCVCVREKRESLYVSTETETGHSVISCPIPVPFAPVHRLRLSKAQLLSLRVLLWNKGKVLQHNQYSESTEDSIR
ncbi:hypothetical protein J4Q44_G00137130 [Coregonus suidteri]|uniref:Uncharacterized protein n=1 Tax=Coregonus suidteri TaxID=861788 RepID=A0AAN8QUD6_9TELE